MYIELLLQFKLESLDTWHKCKSGVVDVQEAIFAWVSYGFIVELWPFDFARMWSGIDFKSLTQWIVLMP